MFMICERLRRPAGLTRRSGFTLIELLVVVAVIGILAGIVLPALAKAKEKAHRITCVSNLKQVGLAIQMYADDNENTLPGPLWAGAKASYHKNESQELLWFIAENLGYPAPAQISPGNPLVAEVFVCPGYFRKAPAVTSMVGRKCYLVNDDLDPNPANKVSPFGYPAPLAKPLKLGSFDSFEPPSSVFAVQDVDKGNVPVGVSWWSDLPYEPVHGAVRNELYFDWHVEAKRW